MPALCISLACSRRLSVSLASRAMEGSDCSARQLLYILRTTSTTPLCWHN